jgi:hypothetical protein
MDILLLLYCLLFIVFASYLAVKFMNYFWTLDNFFLLIILIVYVFIPINIIIFGSELYDYSLKTYLFPTSKFVSFSSFSITFFFIAAFIIGGAFRGSSPKLEKVLFRRFNGLPLYEVASYSLSFLSLISLIIYINQFGDLSSLAINLALSRVDKLDSSLVGNYAFFGRFINFAVIPIIYFLYKKRQVLRDWIFLFFIPLSVLIFNTVFISAGKLNLIILMLILYFTISIRHNKLYLQYLIFISALVFFALPVLDEMFVLAYRVFNKEGLLAVPFQIVSAIVSGSLGQGQFYDFLKDSSENFYLKSVLYFTYIQMSLQFSIDNSYPLLFFSDVLTGFSKLLPSRFNIQLGLGVQELNTAIFYDFYPDLPDVHYGVPPGIIAYAMYSLSLPGVLILAFLLGYIFRGIDILFKSILEIDRRFSSFYAYILVILGIYPINGDPKEVIYNLVFLVFLVTFFTISFKFKFFVEKRQRKLS